jgi:GH15 family glucan-1,4-alpha-glucosidase
MSSAIEDYGIIGDGRTAALVSRAGAIDWLCLPQFDSPACFAALLGDADNGCWIIAPTCEAPRVTRRYLGDTLVLETVFATPEGDVAVLDFMTMDEDRRSLMRIVEGRAGQVEMISELKLRFEYGRVSPFIRAGASREITAMVGPDAVIIRSDRDFECGEGRLATRFSLSAGERTCFEMSWFSSTGPAPPPCDAFSALEATAAWWEDWASRHSYEGPHRDRVVRSLITLKALAHRDTGALIAAPTLGLPEWPQGPRNWDYRFCWLRDATFTLLVFLDAGMSEEAEAFVKWLRRTAGGEPVDLLPLYGASGARLYGEVEADWLTGHDGARPVRIGNGADVQLQLDIYGEVIDTIFFARNLRADSDGDAEALVRLLAARLEDIWRLPDAGIWEVRSDERRHVYSAVMCWVAFDRASRWLGEKDEAARTHYCDLAAQVKAEVLAHGWDEARETFVQAYGSSQVDASNLRLALVGFLPADDPRIVGTVKAVERELLKDGFVLRYLPQSADDGLEGPEGAFFACTLWLADVYILQGRHAEAEALLDRVCGAANDLGLLSEQIMPGERRMLGNFPQALSHLAVVDTALDLRRRGGPVQSRLKSSRGSAEPSPAPNPEDLMV